MKFIHFRFIVSPVVALGLESLSLHFHAEFVHNLESYCSYLQELLYCDF